MEEAKSWQSISSQSNCTELSVEIKDSKIGWFACISINQIPVVESEMSGNDLSSNLNTELTFLPISAQLGVKEIVTKVLSSNFLFL